MIIIKKEYDVLKAILCKFPIVNVPVHFKEITTKFNIFPACLPEHQKKSSFGVHSGWSSPIPYHILSESAPEFTKIYSNFFKQSQIKMEIFERCQDGNDLGRSNGIWESGFVIPANYPTNTYYPPGMWHILLK